MRVLPQRPLRCGIQGADEVMSHCAVSFPAVNDQLTWIDRLIDVTGRHQEPEDGAGWEQVESTLGLVLPSDFKELCRRFAPGRSTRTCTFSGRRTTMRSPCFGRGLLFGSGQPGMSPRGCGPRTRCTRPTRGRV